MQKYAVTLGPDADDIDYGTFDAVDAEAALLAALRDADWTVPEWKIEFLSRSESFGAPAATWTGSGHGGGNRLDWFYVRGADDGSCSVFTARAVDPFD